MKRFQIAFEGDPRPALTVPAGRTLAEDLDITRSPVLFGCRTGICGTCVVEVVKGAESIPGPDEDELEILELYAEGMPNARLACQIDVQGDLLLRGHCVNRWEGVA